MRFNMSGTVENIKKDETNWKQRKIQRSCKDLFVFPSF